MDKDKRHIDQLFKEGLTNNSFEIPASFENDLNQRLDALDKKKEKRGFFLWLIMLLCIVDFTVIALLLLNNQQSPIYSMSGHEDGQIKSVKIDDLQDSKKIVQVKSSNTNFENPITKKPNQNSLIAVSEHSISKKKSASEVKDKKEAAIATDTAKKSIPQQRTPIEDNATKLKKDNLVEISSNIDRKTDDVKQTKNEKTEQSGGLTSNENKSKKVETPINNNGEEAPKTYSNLPKTNKVDEVSPVKTNNEGEVISSTNNQESDSVTDLSQTNIKVKSDTNVNSKEQDDKVAANITAKDRNENIAVEKENNSLQEVSKSIPKWRADIQLYTGFGATIINDNKADEDYLAMVNVNRKPINSPTFGLNGNLSYKNITFGLGLSYLQTGETYSTKMNKINATDIPYFEYDSITETITYYQPYGTLIGDSSYVYLDSTVQYNTILDTTLSTREIKNRYVWISVPVYFGYRFSFGKYEVIPRIGAQFNFGITPNSGQYPDPKFETISSFNVTRFNISYLVNLELRRNFNKWSIFARPYFKSMIGPAINESVLKRKYSSWGLQVGVGFDL